MDMRHMPLVKPLQATWQAIRMSSHATKPCASRASASAARSHQPLLPRIPFELHLHTTHARTHLCRRQQRPSCATNICALHIKRLLGKRLHVMRRASCGRVRPRVSQVRGVGSKQPPTHPTHLVPTLNTAARRVRAQRERRDRERAHKRGRTCNVDTLDTLHTLPISKTLQKLSV